MGKRPISCFGVMVMGLGLGCGSTMPASYPNRSHPQMTNAPSSPQAAPATVAQSEAEVGRDEVRNQDQAAKFMPEVRDGRPVGIRIYDVRPDEVFARIGLQNGDVLTALNGVDIKEPDQALQIYDRMTSVNRFTLALEREGKKIERSFRVR